MSRVRAAQLVLVNWRGVFFQPYLLDEQVTALEGANGAGKTTVMIAAYVVLLPDMTRLRFTSVGEQSATGGDKGIYGRLGTLGSPTYAALDLRLPRGERIVAGVHLERRAEPTVEPTPFLITSLTADAALADVLLDRGEVDTVPDLGRLRELAALAGGKLVVFSSTKDYFSELFERGVTPLRLTGDEERGKYNEMLRTSMVGGISRALTGGLREFLLKEETGLADTLKRMRGNLDACRKTRHEVHEARQLEAEIRGVYEAGQEMFAAAAHATRARAQELRARIEAAQSSLDAAERAEAVQDRELRIAVERRSETKAELDAVRTEHGAVSERHDRTRSANVIERRIRKEEAEHAQKSRQREIAESARREKDELRERARRVRDEASDDRDRAAQGLAEAHRGLEELERKAAGYRLVQDRLGEARRALERPDLDVGDVPAALSTCATRIDELDGEIVSLDRAVDTAERRRREFEVIRAALQRIVRDAVEESAAHETARGALAQLRRLDVLDAQRSSLPREIEEARAQAATQRSARDAASRLSTEARPIRTAADAQAAHEEAEAIAAAHEDGRSRAAEAAVVAERQCTEARGRVQGLAERLRIFRAARAAADALASEWSHPIQTRSDVDALRSLLRRREAEGNAGRDSDIAERDRLRGEATHLEQTGGRFDERLLAARDRVEGELLAGRFEEVAPDEAGRLQALLGPLHEAILVEDVRAAAERLMGTEKRPPTVWLVGSDGLPGWEHHGAPPGEIRGGDVLVAGEAGTRLTRITDQPILGRRAREARIAALRREEQALGRRIEQRRVEGRGIESGIAACDDLTRSADALDRGDPSDAHEAARSEMERAAEAAKEHRSVEREEKVLLDGARARAGALARLLLPVAHLLDRGDLDAERERLEACLVEARRAHEELRRVVEDRRQLERALDVLADVPPTVEQVAMLRERKAVIEAARDREARLAGALRYVDDHRAAFGWSDAERSLREQRSLTPALQERLERAKAALVSADANFRASEEEHAAAVRALQRIEGEVVALEEQLARDRAQLAESGIDDPSDDAVEALRTRAAALAKSVAMLDERERAYSAEVVRCEERLGTARADTNRCRDTLLSEEKAWRPAEENWARLEARAQAEGVLAAAFSKTFEERFQSRGNVNLWPQADGQHTVLVERLARANDGAELAATIKRQLATDEGSRGGAYLDAWLAARDWLRRRVPSQIAEVSEPLEALSRLREHLQRLEDRLAEQEGALRGRSSDVANNIAVQRRKAQRQITRLNQDLHDVRFGSIRGVRIRPSVVERMEQVLRALREGEGQEILFQSSIPIEEAMDELFRQYGGGRTGGLRLLDYREYIDLQVEVRRQASADWEPANPTRMSTGEAIGVGAAVMMVVLTAWERDANLLRGKRAIGTLRLLFLDEATRLSQDNLGILFDLCQSLDLQLIIAAPEVARAEGNTTYRLVRRINESGVEEVIVTGRRTIAGEKPGIASG